MTIKRLLIANRGEIARRVIRTAKSLGIHTIAVYSEADANALHRLDADSTIALGGNTAAESYLDQSKILAAAGSAQADAIHPGYGFLSENADFADACEQAGIIFVGPSGKAITLMGDKAAARLYMQQSGVPVLPGFDDKADASKLAQEADKVGYPLLIKAVAGGGGKGMRMVENSDDFADALAAAQREAKHAFGDDQVLLERYLPTARHVEVQVFADQQGNCVYLFERDCSVQRRHQKVVEEAPAPLISDELRQQMGEAACRAANSIGYQGAGTVEFLLAPEGDFFFMEMNTRLQVEHPVTEAITGTDLVAWQLSVAAGEPLPCRQDELHIDGHSMEVRLYAEDPWQNFLPASGPIERLEWPHGIRIDTGVCSGDEVSPLYDPMIAKLISHGRDRDEARERLTAALDRLQLAGFRHNAGFLRQLLASDTFARAELSTRLLEQHPELMEKPSPSNELLALAACLALKSTPEDGDPWSRLSGWRPLGDSQHQRTLGVDGDIYSVNLNGNSARIGDQQAAVSWTRDAEQQQLELQWGDSRFSASYWHDTQKQRLLLFHQGEPYEVELSVSASSHADDDQGFVAPMNGTLLLQHVEAGVEVAAGDAVVTMEAMKMEHTLYAPSDGRVTAFHAKPGDAVSAGSELLIFEANDTEAE